MKKAGLSEGQKQIYEAFQTYGVKDYTVIQKGDVKIAVLGVFGKDSLDCAPTCELLFKDPSEAARETVEEIKKNEDVDMIACVSHSGTWEDEKVSEDEILAKNVPDIDLIVSGHTHTVDRTNPAGRYLHRILWRIWEKPGNTFHDSEREWTMGTGYL